jgi:transposase-like protein
MARTLEGLNKAFSETENSSKKAVWLSESIYAWQIPCIFISYQRDDEAYAKRISEYIISKGISVYFDLKDISLKFYNQNNKPKQVTSSIKKGIEDSDYMIVIVSPKTMNSAWVPFEIGYAYENMEEDKMVCLKHKGIKSENLPPYLQTKQLLEGFSELSSYLKWIRKQCKYIYESLEGRQAVKTFSEPVSNPLSEYLDA